MDFSIPIEIFSIIADFSDIKDAFSLISSNKEMYEYYKGKYRERLTNLKLYFLHNINPNLEFPFSINNKRNLVDIGIIFDKVTGITKIINITERNSKIIRSNYRDLILIENYNRTDLENNIRKINTIVNVLSNPRDSKILNSMANKINQYPKTKMILNIASNITSEVCDYLSQDKYKQINLIDTENLKDVFVIKDDIFYLIKTNDSYNFLDKDGIICNGTDDDIIPYICNYIVKERIIKDWDVFKDFKKIYRQNNSLLIYNPEYGRQITGINRNGSGWWYFTCDSVNEIKIFNKKGEIYKVSFSYEYLYILYKNGKMYKHVIATPPDFIGKALSYCSAKEYEVGNYNCIDFIINSANREIMLLSSDGKISVESL